jgi:hypothetical protein
MAKIAVLELEVDVQMAFDSLTDRDRKELISENLSVCDVDDMIDEISSRGDMKCMIRAVAGLCYIEDVINDFKQKEIEEWLDNHAEEYGYTKMED